MFQSCYLHKVLENLVSLIDKETYRESYLSVYDGKEKYQMSCIHIFYIESENDKVFVYTLNRKFQCKKKLYELENELPDYFSRISKSAILNLRKVEHYSPQLNGVMKAVLNNQQVVYISRKYLREIRLKNGRGMYEKGRVHRRTSEKCEDRFGLIFFCCHIFDVESRYGSFRAFFGEDILDSGDLHWCCHNNTAYVIF